MEVIVELAKGRDFGAYRAGMDASKEVKLAELLPHVVPGRIVDGGCASGTFLAALAERYPMSELIGVDYSTTFLAEAVRRFRNCPNVGIVRGRVEDLDVLVTEPATTVILASILHEVHSYNGYDETPVHRALTAASRVLAPGGRLLIRDGIAPDRAVVALECSQFDGASTGSIAELSTEAMFYRFRAEYRGGIGVPADHGWQQRYRSQNWLLRARDAYEFLAKKDYRANWEQEVQEEYGFWREREWRAALERAGLEIRVFQKPVNPWIVEHRFQGHVWLRDPISRAELPHLPTHCVIVAEKPEDA